MLQSIRSVLASPVAYQLWWNLVGGPAWARTLVREYIQPTAGIQILEIGCGPGTLVHYLPPSVYLGFDLSPKYIRKAQRRFPEARFVCERVSQFSLEKQKSFDAVIALGIVHHLDDAEAGQLFQIAHDALKPGGRLVTVDGVWTDDQSTAARWLLARDRGEYVRNEQEYKEIAALLHERETKCSARPSAHPVYTADPGMCSRIPAMTPGAVKFPAPSAGISVVIPVYGSEKILPQLLPRLEKVLASVASRREIILVNDCSPDDSWDVIVEMAARLPDIKPINLMRNYGQHNALLCGIRAATCDVIVTMDDDLQHPPEEIPRLLARLNEGFDVVYGTPQREEHGLLRNLASITTKVALQNVMGAEIARQVCAFRAFRREVVASFAHYEGYFVSIDVLLTWGTNRFTVVPVLHQARAQGASGYTFRKLLTHAMNMMTGFTTMPLQFASWVGFAFTVLSFCLLLYVLLRYLVSGNPVPGFPFLASIIGLFSGAQLFALGIIGEYLARIHLRSMQKPPYVVRQFGVQSQTKRATASSL